MSKNSVQKAKTAQQMQQELTPTAAEDAPTELVNYVPDNEDVEAHPPPSKSRKILS